MQTERHTSKTQGKTLNGRGEDATCFIKLKINARDATVAQQLEPSEVLVNDPCGHPSVSVTKINGLLEARW